jgi:hypothetical protein
MSGISCKETRPGYCEISIYGWHIVLKQDASASGKWYASAEPLVEPFTAGDSIVAKNSFEEKNEALRWGLDQTGEKWAKVFLEWQTSTLKLESASQLLQRPIFERFRKYDVPTTVSLLEGLLFRTWGTELVRVRQASEVLRKMENSDLEPLVMFWNIFCYVLPTWSPGPYQYVAQGSLHLSSDAIDAEVHRWALELIELPFYPTINLFAQAVDEWLHSCDLRPFSRDGTQRMGMEGVLRLFEPG